MNLPGVLTSEKSYNAHFCTLLICVITYEQLETNFCDTDSVEAVCFSPADYCPVPAYHCHHKYYFILPVLERAEHLLPGLYNKYQCPTVYEGMYSTVRYITAHGGTWLGTKISKPQWIEILCACFQ